MTFLESLAEQVPEWPRETLARDFAAAVRGQIGSTLSAPPGRPRKDQPAIALKRSACKLQPLRSKVRVTFEARRAA